MVYNDYFKEKMKQRLFNIPLVVKPYILPISQAMSKKVHLKKLAIGKLDRTVILNKGEMKFGLKSHATLVAKVSDRAVETYSKGGQKKK